MSRVRDTQSAHLDAESSPGRRVAPAESATLSTTLPGEVFEGTKLPYGLFGLVRIPGPDPSDQPR